MPVRIEKHTDILKTENQEEKGNAKKEEQEWHDEEGGKKQRTHKAKDPLAEGTAAVHRRGARIEGEDRDETGRNTEARHVPCGTWLFRVHDCLCDRIPSLLRRAESEMSPRSHNGYLAHFTSL
ncbi:hypothetical protein NDU88_000762 [Pleurodeles waltl]|uniref:Uncharacterized protein n=1 Tax=Pleurodeles waltl TaxID=8319 RepID=A0AAV7KR37_PLEWA|nr:hypothetical protein NDU88_000762 [Pleurodeles waltl]